VAEPTWKDDLVDAARSVGVPVAAAIAALTAAGYVAGRVVVADLAGIDTADHEVARWFADHRRGWITTLTGAATFVADSMVVAALWVAAMAVGWWRTRSLAIPVFLMAAIGGEKLTYLFTGLLVGRPRPPVEPIGDVFATHSFPSGHVASVIVLYGGVALAVRWRSALVLRLLLVVVGVVALLVGFSRLYRGHHYPSDVVWGAGLGLFWLLFAKGLADPTSDAEGTEIHRRL